MRTNWQKNVPILFKSDLISKGYREQPKGNIFAPGKSVPESEYSEILRRSSAFKGKSCPIAQC